MRYLCVSYIHLLAFFKRLQMTYGTECMEHPESSYDLSCLGNNDKEIPACFQCSFVPEYLKAVGS